MCLAQGPQSSDAGEARTLGLESSTIPLPSLFLIDRRLVAISKEPRLQPARRKTTRLQHHRAFQIITCRTDKRKMSFFPRTVRDWNAHWLLILWTQKHLKPSSRQCHPWCTRPAALHIGNNMEDTVYTMETTNGRVPIQKVQKEKDLGVTFDSKLNFTEHISSKVKEANQIVGAPYIQNIHIYGQRNVPESIQLPCPPTSGIYATTIWPPLYKKDAIQIENV